MEKTVMERAEAVKEYCTMCRRRLHRRPELSLREYETTEFIKQELRKMGIPILDIPLETGAVAIIEGKNPGPVSAIRADIDALPITEETGKPYASENPGVMHACGHDGHAAILMGIAKVLWDMRDELRGIVKLIFQPGEEGLLGARKVIESGALKDPDVESIVCWHGWPYLKVGEVGAWPGQYMASADMFDAVMKGQGGHGCRPYKAVNPIVATAAAVSAIQNICASEIVTAQQAVISVCKIHAGIANNVIPDSVEFGGTVRCLDPEVRLQLERKLKRTIEGAAATFGCECEINYIHGVPSLYNSPEIVRELLSAAEQVLGCERIKELDGPVMGGEDFSYYVEEGCPGVFMRLGIAAEGEEERTLHNCHFDFNDDAIPAGVAVMVQYILNKHGEL